MNGPAMNGPAMNGPAVSGPAQSGPAVSRRELLRGAARWLVLAAGGGALAGLMTKRGAACERGEVCGGCPLLPGCALPQAKTQRAKAPTR